MTKRSIEALEAAGEIHHLFHGEISDIPGRGERWDDYLRYRGNGRWELITQSTDFSGMSDLPNIKERMSTRQMVQWVLDRDSEQRESQSIWQDENDDPGDDEVGRSLGEYAERLREIAVKVNASHCVRCLDGWVNETWPREPKITILRVTGVTRRGVWIRVSHNVFTVETNLGGAYMYPPSEDGYARVVLMNEQSMATGRQVRLSKEILRQSQDFRSSLDALKS